MKASVSVLPGRQKNFFKDQWLDFGKITLLVQSSPISEMIAKCAQRISAARVSWPCYRLAREYVAMRCILIAAGWFLAAIALSGSGFLQRLRPPAPQLIIAGLTTALLAAWRVSARFRQWMTIIDLRALVGLHLTRFIGLYFLLLCRRGELPWCPGGMAGRHKRKALR